jgi:hypothetical protein
MDRKKQKKKINKETWPTILVMSFYSITKCRFFFFFISANFISKQRKAPQLKVGFCSLGDSCNRGDIKKLKLDWNSHNGICFFHIRQQKVFATASFVVPSHPAPSLALLLLLPHQTPAINKAIPPLQQCMIIFQNFHLFFVLLVV